MLFAADKYGRLLAIMFAHFQYGGHEPEVLISHHVWHLADNVKAIVMFAHMIFRPFL